MRIRTAERAECEEITELINDAFRVESFFKIGDRITAEEVRKRFDKGVFFVAEDEDGLAGCVYVEIRGEHAYLGLLSVDPAHQRLGVGGSLMAYGENIGREAGCWFVDIEIVNLRPELQPYYERRGYVETGTAPFPVPERTNTPCHFIKMSKPLAHSPG